MKETNTIGVALQRCVDELQMEVIAGKEYLDRLVTRTMLSRPGVEIYSNFFNYYERDRIQVLGSKEYMLYEKLSDVDKTKRVAALFAANPPAFIFTKNVSEVPQDFINAANEYKIPVLKTHLTTTSLIGNLSTFLVEEIAERRSIHGVMLDVFGVGVLLTGKSFVGKSEAALELIKRGHILVADDRVEVSQHEVGVLIGRSPEVTQRLIEVRGIGIIDVVSLFGVVAFREKKQVNLIVDLVKWNQSFDYNRLVLEEEYAKIFDTMIPKVTIPVQPGRNLATLIEVACKNHLAKTLGYNASVEFANKIDELVKKGGK